MPLYFWGNSPLMIFNKYVVCRNEGSLSRPITIGTPPLSVFFIAFPLTPLDSRIFASRWSHLSEPFVCFGGQFHHSPVIGSFTRECTYANYGRIIWFDDALCHMEICLINFLEKSAHPKILQTSLTSFSVSVMLVFSAVGPPLVQRRLPNDRCGCSSCRAV